MKQAIVVGLDTALVDLTRLSGLDPHALSEAALTVAPRHYGIYQNCRSAMASGMAVLIVSDRPRVWRDRTIGWLRDQDIRYEYLGDRREGDWASASHVKAEQVRELVGYYDIVRAFDRDQAACNAYAALGVPQAISQF